MILILLTRLQSRARVRSCRRPTVAAIRMAQPTTGLPSRMTSISKEGQEPTRIVIKSRKTNDRLFGKDWHDDEEGPSAASLPARELERGSLRTCHVQDLTSTESILFLGDASNGDNWERRERGSSSLDLGNKQGQDKLLKGTGDQIGPKE